MENHMENHDSIEMLHEDPGFRNDQPHSISEDVCITVSHINMNINEDIKATYVRG